MHGAFLTARPASEHPTANRRLPTAMIFVTCHLNGQYTVEETDVPELKSEDLSEQEAIAAVVMLATAFNDPHIYTRVPSLGLTVHFRVDVELLQELADRAGVRRFGDKG